MSAETDLPVTGADQPRWPVLAAIGFLLGVLGYLLWAVVGLPAPLLGLLAVVMCWLALRRLRACVVQQQTARGAWLARWGLRLGVLKLILFAGYLVFAAVDSLSTTAA